MQAVVRRRLILGVGCWWHRCSASSLPSPASSPASFFWIWGSFWAAGRPGTVGGVLGWREKYRQKKKSVSRASAKKSHFSGSYSLTLGGIWCAELLLWRVRGGGSGGGVLPVELPLGLGGGWLDKNAQGEGCQFHENGDFKKAITQREK